MTDDAIEITDENTHQCRFTPIHTSRLVRLQRCVIKAVSLEPPKKEFSQFLVDNTMNSAERAPLFQITEEHVENADVFNIHLCRAQI